jgi:hypothetical protein
MTFVTVLSAKARLESYPAIMQRVSTFYTYEGDRYNQFAGDATIVLSDGSAWKTHPEDSQKLNRFVPGDWVHVGVRPTWYFFKREHKFELVNHNNGEKIRVMLARHASQPKYVVACEKIYENTEAPDATTPKNKRPTPSAKKLTLNDGSVWMLKEKLGYFSSGNTVCIGANFDETHFDSFYIINGTQREAVYARVKPVLY